MFLDSGNICVKLLVQNSRHWIWN